MFYLYDYPIPGRDGLPLCKVHGKKLEMLKVVIFDMRLQPVNTVGMDCPGKDSIRLWPLPVVGLWFERRKATLYLQVGEENL